MLKKKDLELQESLLKFNKFLQENDSKRGRAEKKEKEEIKQRSLKEQDIKNLNEALAQKKAERYVTTLGLQKMMKYQYFLESVLDAAEEFPEISDLLSRYDTLDAAHVDLVNRSMQAAEYSEAQRHELQQFIRDKTDQILGCNNQIAELQKQSERISEDVRKQSDDADRQMQAVAERTLQLGQVMMACENIYQRCCDRSSVARKRLGADADEEVEVLIEKLLFIRDYLTDLTAITKGHRARELTKSAEQPAALASSPEKAPHQPHQPGAAAASGSRVVEASAANPSKFASRAAPSSQAPEPPVSRSHHSSQTLEAH